MLRVQSRSVRRADGARSSDACASGVEGDRPFQGIERVGSASTTSTTADHPAGRPVLLMCASIWTMMSAGLGVTKDFESFEFLGITSTEDIRNGFCSGESRGKYCAWTGPTRAPSGRSDSGTLSGCRNPTIWSTGSPAASSAAVHYWTSSSGPDPRPSRPAGWLHVYHGVRPLREQQHLPGRRDAARAAGPGKGHRTLP